MVIMTIDFTEIHLFIDACVFLWTAFKYYKEHLYINVPLNLIVAMESIPHVDVEGVDLINTEATGPMTVRVVHDTYTQQLI